MGSRFVDRTRYVSHDPAQIGPRAFRLAESVEAIRNTGEQLAAGVLKDLLTDIVLGKDPVQIEAPWGEKYDHSFWAKGGGPIIFAAISAIEMACWDIKANVLGVPVYEERR